MGVEEQDLENLPPDAQPEENEVFGLEKDVAARLVPEFEAISQGEALLYDGKYAELIAHCEATLKQHPQNISLWKLMGVAEGNAGNLSAARASFLSALRLDPEDPVTLSNYVHACFDTHDKEAACEALEQYFGKLDFDGQATVLESLLESVKAGHLTFKDLPIAVLEMLTAADDEQD